MSGQRYRGRRAGLSDKRYRVRLAGRSGRCAVRRQPSSHVARQQSGAGAAGCRAVDEAPSFGAGSAGNSRVRSSTCWSAFTFPTDLLLQFRENLPGIASMSKLAAFARERYSQTLSAADFMFSHVAPQSRNKMPEHAVAGDVERANSSASRPVEAVSPPSLGAGSFRRSPRVSAVREQRCLRAA